MVDLTVVSDKSFLVVGLLKHPQSLILWQTRKLQAIWSMELDEASVSYSTISFCRSSKSNILQLLSDLEDFSCRTPALPADNSAWNTVCEGTCNEFREIGCLILSDPQIDAHTGHTAKTCVPLKSKVFYRLYITGGGQQPGQAHLFDLHEMVGERDIDNEMAENFPISCSVMGTTNSIISVSRNGCIYVTKADGCVLKVTSQLLLDGEGWRHSDHKEEFPWSLSLAPNMPLIARYIDGGHVDVFLTHGTFGDSGLLDQVRQSEEQGTP